MTLPWGGREVGLWSQTIYTSQLHNRQHEHWELNVDKDCTLLTELSIVQLYLVEVMYYDPRILNNFNN